MDKAHALSEYHYHTLLLDGVISSHSLLMRLPVIAFWLRPWAEDSGTGHSNAERNWEIDHLRIFPLSLTSTRPDTHSGNTSIDLIGVFCLEEVFSIQERGPLELGGTPVFHEDVTMKRERAPRTFFSVRSEKMVIPSSIKQNVCQQLLVWNLTSKLWPWQPPLPTYLSVVPLVLQLIADGRISQG